MSHLELTVKDAPGLLERVVGACRSRQCTITSLHYHRGDRHRPGRVEITLVASRRATDLAVQRLAKLVDVVSVAEHVEHAATGLAHEEAPNAPWLIGERVKDLAA